MFFLCSLQGVNTPARLVIVKGTEYFDGKTSRYVDYPLTDCLQMIGRAGRPGFDTEGTAVVLVEASKKNFYKKFLYTPFPVESCLRERLCENLNAEIATGTVNSLLDAVGYLTWTFFARRVKANPSYYGAASSSGADIEEFLDKVAAETLDTLKQEGCIEKNDDDEVKATVLGHAVSEYYLNHKTAKQMEFGLKECAKMILLEEIKTVGGVGEGIKHNCAYPFVRPSRLEEISVAWILYTLCCTHEFDELPVRHNEEFLNEELSSSLMWGADTSAVLSVDGRKGYIDSEIYADPHTKGFLLLQAFLQKSKLPISDYVNDSKTVMDSVPRLLAAMQFIASHEGASADGSFDVLCQIIRTKQLISTRSTTRTHPASQLAGINETVFNAITKKLDHSSPSKHPGKGHSSPSNTLSLLQLRQSSRDKVLKAMNNVHKGTAYHAVIDSLYALPLVTLKEAKVYHEIDKQSGASVGTLKLSIQIDRQKASSSSKDDFYTVLLALGSFDNQQLLGSSELSISRHGTWCIDKELQFDWKIANANGGENGGQIILRLLLDSARGLDSEVIIGLQ
jgi:hypothetical protein